MKRHGPPLSYANVVATLALFVALGGGAYAAATIGSDDVSNNSLRSADIRGRAKPYTPGTLRSADIAAGGIHTQSLSNRSITPKKLAAPPPWNQVGDADGPAFGECPGTPNVPGWSNYADPRWNRAAFYRDAGGVVHLRGLVRHECQNAVGPIFTLPAGYRPAAQEMHGALGHLSRGVEDDYALFRIDIGVDGTIVREYPPLKREAFVSLDGITFRCAPAGEAGCP